MPEISGNAVILSADISANEILDPAWYGTELNTQDDRTFAQSDTSLGQTEHPVLMVGANFGYGSANESVVIALQKAGVRAIVGTEFPNYFFRNALNAGLPVFTIAEPLAKFTTDEPVTIDTSDGTIRKTESDEVLTAGPQPEFVQRLMDIGGITTYLRTLKSQTTKEKL